MKGVLANTLLLLKYAQNSRAFSQFGGVRPSAPVFKKIKPVLYAKKQKDAYSVTNYEFCQAKNTKQQKYIDALNHVDTKILFAIGPAGTGKTLIACNHAMKLLQSDKIKRIVITRPIVPVEEEEIGFLPGTLNKKMNPWLRPLFDVFLEMYSQTQLDRMMFDNIIEIAPLAFMRGRTFKNTLIIADEMQNSTPNQMLMLLTRIGQGSKLVVTGDMKQTDIDTQKENGLSDVIKKTKKYITHMEKKHATLDNSIQIVEFTNKEIERSRVVRKILDVYNIDRITETCANTDPQSDNKTTKSSLDDASLFKKYSTD